MRTAHAPERPSPHGQARPRIRYWRHWLLHAVAIAPAVLCAVFMSGCDGLAISDLGLVKQKVRKHSAAINNEDWDGAAALYHPRMIWIGDGRKLRGTAAQRAFIASIKDIRGRNGFHTDIVGIKALDPKRIAVAVAFKVTITENSMSLAFSNRVWKAKILFVLEGRGNWRIAKIQEVSPRVREVTNPGG